MPLLKKLSITRLRNLDTVTIAPSPAFNFIYGENGSGKSSMLEAIFLLGRAKTFRSASKTPIIQIGTNDCVIHALLDEEQSLGFSRTQSGDQQIRINGQNAGNSAELAQKLPLQLFNADAFKILEGGPGVRRGFLDWGVFHVEQDFISHWRQAQRALLNRNSLLKKRNIDHAELKPWTQEFCRHAEEVHKYREAYIKKYVLSLSTTLNEMLPLDSFSLKYVKGWEQDEDLEAVLSKSLDKDIKYGHTASGPHRADLKIQIGSESAAEHLSRGQQKLLLIAMKFSQAILLKEQCSKSCVFLLDDLPAELDSANRSRVLAMLSKLGEQAFITGIAKQDLLESMQEIGKEMKLFHVEHGKIATE
tara:strand:- start:2522 stop:3604 length:1083 start_codon:yes stop_codon:yes gene_type:complete